MCNYYIKITSMYCCMKHRLLFIYLCSINVTTMQIDVYTHPHTDTHLLHSYILSPINVPKCKISWKIDLKENRNIQVICNLDG